MGSETYYVGINLDSPDCDHVVDFLEQRRQVPIKSHFNVYDKPDWWKNPGDIWVGAIPGYDADFVRPSPANTFAPTFSPPCLGLVPPPPPLCVLRRPRAHIVGVKFEQIFSKPMAAFLASLAPCQFGDVMLGNAVLSSHRRLFPQLSRKVLATDAMRYVRGGCAVCSSPLLAHAGHPLGRLVDDLVVCRNEEGVGHLAAEHPIIVSVAVAQEMKRRFRGGYSLQPILDIDSRCGQRILQLFRRLQALEALGEKNGEEISGDATR
jgi:hypothetical protein